MDGAASVSRVTLLALFVAAAAGPPAAGAPPGRGTKLASRPAGVAGLPLSFEPNRGQAGRAADFLTRGPGFLLALSAGEATLALHPRGGLVGAAVRMALSGADPTARPEPLERLPGTVNYFSGRDPRSWLTAVPTFARIRYRGVYPGIDVEFYGNERRVEYDFIVAPGANPSHVRMAISGHSALRIAPDGDLVIGLGERSIRLSRPVISQVTDGQRVAVAGGFALRGGEVSFSVPSFDRSRPLLIDPIVLDPSTYLGGTGFDEATDVKVDAAGNIYVFGSTSSVDFPTAGGAHAQNNGGYRDAFVAKLAPDGNSLIYATYLGGSKSDECLAGAIDAQGNAYLTGWTLSDTDFPVTAGTYQPTYGGDGPFWIGDSFLAKVAPTGDNLVFASYLGGNSEDHGTGIAADAAGNAYVTGWTMSWDFPTTPGTFKGPKSFGTRIEGFITKVNPTGSSLAYSSCLGGSAPLGDYYASAVAVDTAGSAYLVGRTSCTDLPTTPGALQSSRAGDSDLLITKVNPSGSALVYATYFGGRGGETAAGIAVDTQGNAYVTGETCSSDLPLKNPLQSSIRGCDVFISKLNPSGSGLLYSTFLGGTGGETARAIAVDGSGRALVVGETSSNDFPTRNAVQTSRAGSSCLKSEDGGATWTATGIGDVSAMHVAINPARPATILAGTWDRGLLDSEDGGATWQPLGTDSQVFAVDFETGNADAIWVATMAGVHRFNGTTWQKRSGNLSYVPSDLAVDPGNPQTVWAAAGQLYKTTNGGGSWTVTGPATGGASITAIAVEPANPQVVYAGAGSLGIFKTTDGGATWGAATLTGEDVQEIVVDPGSPGTVWVAGWKGPFRSTDGGLTWSPRRTGLPEYGATSLALAPGTPQTVYAAGCGGSFRSTDGGATWLSLGVASLCIQAVAVDPTDPRTVLLATTLPHTDAFVAKLKASGSGLVYSTYLGGLDTDVAQGVAAGADGSACVAGKTGYGFPVAGTFQAESAGGVEAFVARLAGDGEECVLDCTANVPVDARLGDPVELEAATAATACSGTAIVEWDFGDGTSGAGAAVSHSYHQTGTYTWRMTAAIAGDTCAVSGAITIYTCEISCSATVPAAGLPGTSMVFAGSASAPHCDGSPSIRWAFGDGSAPSTETAPAHAYASVGQYAWTMLAEADGARCVQSGTVAVSAQQVEVVLADGFEGDFPGPWAVTPPTATHWGPSTHRTASGAKSAYCAGGGAPAAPAGGPYFAGMETGMVFGPFSLAGATAARATFAYWLDTEQGWDWFSWAVSVNGTSFSGSRTSGTAAGWQTRELDLASVGTITPLGSPQVWLAFFFDSDNVVQREGVYVDDVRIERTLPGGGGCTVTSEATVPAAALAGVAVPLAASASLSGCAGPLAYAWDFGDGSPPSNVQSPQHVWAAAGRYLWQVTAAAGGNAAGRSGVVDIAMPPVAPVRRHLRR